MSPVRRGLCAVLAALMLLGGSAPVFAAAKAAPLSLTQVVDTYWDAYLHLNPSVATASGDHRYDDRLENRASEAYLGNSLALERSALEQLAQIPSTTLTGQDRLTYALFRTERERRIAALRFPDELLCLEPFGGTLQYVVELAAGRHGQVFRTTEDYERFLRRLEDLVAWTRTAGANLRQGLARGITQPRVVAERLPAVLQSLIVTPPEGSPFYQPLLRLPAAISADDRSRLQSAYRETIATRLNPALESLQRFVVRDYVPGTRTSLAWTDLPLGESWYAGRVAEAATTTQTPAQLHALGQRELVRLGAALDALLPGVVPGVERAAAFEALAHEPRFAPASAADLVAAAAQLEATAAVSLKGLPRWRQQVDFPAWSQGLGLYAYGLAPSSTSETPDPYREASVLATRLEAIALLVIDTGVHSQRWTRAQAIRTLRSSLPISEAAATAAVDRCIAEPGRAVAPALGALKIDALRLQAEQRLGTRFDALEFHRALLREGPLPLAALEASVRDWLATAAAAAPDEPPVPAP